MKAVPTVLRTAAALCAAALVAVPLAASPASAATQAGADLVITVTAAKGGGAYRYLLTCDPDGGSHPRPGDACRTLQSVDGTVEELDVDPGPCLHVYAPVDVKVVGGWYGRRIAYHHEFPNRCLMSRTLGPVV
ncbi:SSI family serine proteinase inhibitor [Nonomuraea wenchangensis]|uniref:SSI family serine proteinase inhibitor n=1 Tax=Nonomuraea wenchangensis TaxID=568860 RepID=UPI00332BC510